MNKRSAVLALLLALTWSMPLLADGHADEAEAAPAPTASVTGKLVLPEETPEWFRGGELDLSSAKVRLEGSFERPAPPFPEGFADMTREEKMAWQREFMKSDEYKAFVEKSRAAYEGRPIIEVAVNADGSFKAEGIKPDRYVVNAVIPHADANPDRLTYHSWASARGGITVAEDEAGELGELAMRLKNVVMPGEQAPAWTAKDYDGNEIKLSDFRGKYVLVDFWATWCGPCKAEIPNLEAVYKDYAGDKFEMVGLSLDKTIDLPKQFHEENHSPYVHAYLGEWNRSETTARDYGVTGIPSIWLIGPDGTVVARDLRGEALREAVKKAVQGEGGIN